jgi:hypothetical protein
VSKVLALVLVMAAPAFADPVPASPSPMPSPYGTSPFVVAYQPPPPEIDHAHHGLTLEAALGGGSTSLDASAGAVTFAIGGWATHDLAISFRITGVGRYDFVGASAQYFPTHALWFGAGLGALDERSMDAFGDTARTSGGGGFVRAGYNLATSGAHALYLSGELQLGGVGGQLRSVGLLALGYQLL